MTDQAEMLRIFEGHQDRLIKAYGLYLRACRSDLEKNQIARKQLEKAGLKDSSEIDTAKANALLCVLAAEATRYETGIFPVPQESP